ncbi:MAG: M23 family metallopeptidase [Xanthomonadales bacterium]|nr:M23 family metallopeptidase [Xanthomonadales bacterium]
MRPGILFSLLLLSLNSFAEIPLQGKVQPGAVLFGQAKAGSQVLLNDKAVPIAANGRFVIGFGRDAKGTFKLEEIHLQGRSSQLIELQPREYKLEKIDGLPPSKVSPQKPEVLARIKREGAQVAAARTRRDAERLDYSDGFIWPVKGRLSGFYGSQRILNGVPKRPHYGLDIAATTGTPIIAPAAGIVTLAAADLYYSGGTIILDHGQGFSSTFLHMSKVEVEVGQRVEQGDKLGKVGATGRASGPHLDWRMNWLDQRVDPQPLLPPAAE